APLPGLARRAAAALRAGPPRRQPLPPGGLTAPQRAQRPAAGGQVLLRRQDPSALERVGRPHPPKGCRRRPSGFPPLPGAPAPSDPPPANPALLAQVHRFESRASHPVAPTLVGLLQRPSIGVNLLAGQGVRAGGGRVAFRRSSGTSRPRP